MVIKIIFVILGTVAFTVLALGVCKFIESIVLRKKSSVEKYSFFRATIDKDLALNSRQSKLNSIFSYGFRLPCVVLIMVITLRPWIGLVFNFSVFSFPFFLSALALRHDEDGRRIFRKELAEPLKDYFLGMIIVVPYVCFCILVIVHSLTSVVFFVLSTILSLLAVFAAIWVVFGGIGRLIKKIIKRLSRIKLPKLRLKIPPQPIPQT